MRVSKEVEELMVNAVLSNCIKQDGTPASITKVSVRNVCHYINKVNRDLKPDQTVYENMNTSDMMFPAGLAAFLDPRRVQFDINNRLQKNLIATEVYEDRDVVCHTFIKGKEKDGKDDREDVNPNYGYSDFLQDLTRIKVAMRCSDLQLTVSVAQAVKDVDVLSVVDRLEINGNVKWSGALGSEFIPIKLGSAFSLGLVEEEYCISTNLMLRSMFSMSVKDIFTK